ncbi:MAG: hypothetical protein ABFC71_02790 [Methanoregula sp.]
MFEKSKNYSVRDWTQLIFLGLILCIGTYLIIFSLYMVAANKSGSLDLYMLAIAAFGVACTMIWFAISNFRITSTEQKLEHITARLDDIISRIEKK